VVGVTFGGSGLAVVGFAVAASIGPAVVAIMFGAEFRPSWWLVGGAAGGVVLAAVGLALNQVMIAMEDETALLPAWGAALVVAVAVVVLYDGDPVRAVTAAFVVGEIVAVLGLAVIARGQTQRLAT
jgi:hypothetical protein